MRYGKARERELHPWLWYEYTIGTSLKNFRCTIHVEEFWLEESFEFIQNLLNTVVAVVEHFVASNPPQKDNS